MKKTIIIMSGIPCSGKSTWARKYQKHDYRYVQIISKDNIRKYLFGDLSKYKINNEDEKSVETEFQTMLYRAVTGEYPNTIIIDNTHCREKYLDQYIKTLKKGNSLYIKFIDCSLIKALFRNLVRKVLTRRWIPIKILKIMKSNYDHINRDKYLPWTTKN